MKKYDVLLLSVIFILVAILVVKSEKEEPENYLLIIGDSRMVYMNYTVGDNEHIQYNAIVGDGFYLFRDAITQIYDFSAKYNTSYTHAKILCNLGVNDLARFPLYRDMYERLVADGIDITFMTVNPVDENVPDYAYDVTNEEVDSFNDYMRAIDGLNILDTNKILKADGYATVDGLHYTDETSEYIYHLICDYFQIEKIEENREEIK